MPRSPASSFSSPLDVHVWRVGAAAPSPAGRGRLLRDSSPDRVLDAVERARAARYAFEDGRQAFIARRAALRHVLGRYTGEAPEAIRFAQGSNGKPRLERSPADLHFNVTHSAGRSLIAVAPGRRVGVDLESVEHGGRPDEVVEVALSPRELEAWRALPDELRPAAFLRAWTCKEAFLKATGEGLARRPSGFAIPKRLPAALDREGTTWSVSELRPWPEFAAALAVEGGHPRITLYDWPDGSLSP